MKIRINKETTIELKLGETCTIKQFLGAAEMLKKLNNFTEETGELSKIKSGQHKWTEEEKEALIKHGARWTAEKYGIEARKAHTMRCKIRNDMGLIKKRKKR